MNSLPPITLSQTCYLLSVTQYGLMFMGNELIEEKREGRGLGNERK